MIPTPTNPLTKDNPMTFDREIAAMLAPRSLLDAAQRRVIESLWDESKVERENGRFARKDGIPGEGGVDLFGQPLKADRPALDPIVSLGGKQQSLFAKNGLPGQMALFADAGVPDGMVATLLEKPVSVGKIDLVPANTGVDVLSGDHEEGRDETKPSSGEPAMQPLTVTFSGNATEKQQQYIDALLGKINQRLEELAAVAPKSTDAVATGYRAAVADKHANASMVIDRLKTIEGSDILGEAYRQAERVLRDKQEKDALRPMREAAVKAFNAIPVRYGQ